MSYSYARINLEKTKYKKIGSCEILLNPDPNQLREIYYKYCNHHKFNSVMPLFDIEFEENTIIGYYDGDVLVGFSMICEFDNENAEAYQFAWDYANPKLHLGIKSLRNECAMYKELGYKYLYIGGADEYKQKIDGFEIMSPAAWIDERWTIDGFEPV
jgi:hypothetical protein